MGRTNRIWTPGASQSGKLRFRSIGGGGRTPLSWGVSEKSRTTIGDQSPGNADFGGNPINSRAHPTYSATRTVGIARKLAMAGSIAIAIPRPLGTPSASVVLSTEDACENSRAGARVARFSFGSESPCRPRMRGQLRWRRLDTVWRSWRRGRPIHRAVYAGADGRRDIDSADALPGAAGDVRGYTYQAE